MDLSKLPKLSDTPKPQESEPEPSPSPSPSPPAAQPPSEVFAGVWISLIIGALLMLVGRNFGSFILSKMTGNPFHTHVIWNEGPKAGQEVAYFDLEGMTAWTDAGLFLFGLAMILDGVVLLMATSRYGQRIGVLKRIVLLIALLCAVGTTLLNLYIAIRLLGQNIVPLMSGLAVAIGGYMSVMLFTMFVAERKGRRAGAGL